MKTKQIIGVQLVISFLLCISACTSFSTPIKEQPLYPIQENGLYGYIDSLGNKVIPAEYLCVSKFSEGLAVAVVDTIHECIVDSTWLKKGFSKVPEVSFFVHYKYGYINQNNEFVIPAKFIKKCEIDKMTDAMILIKEQVNYQLFNNGLALYEDSFSRFGYLNKQGDLAIDCIYNFAKPFSEGKAAVQSFPSSNSARIVKDWTKLSFAERKKYKWGYIKTDGSIFIDFKYLTANTYKNGRASVILTTKSDFAGLDSYNRLLLDEKGYVVGRALDDNYDYYSFWGDGLAVAKPIYTTNTNDIGYWFINRKGEFIKPLEGMTKSQLDSISNLSTVVAGLPPEKMFIKRCTRFVDGYAGITADEKRWVFVDRNLVIRGHDKNDFIYEDINPFSNGLAAVKKNGKWGYVNTDFEYVIPCVYDSASKAEKHLVKVILNKGENVTIESYINRENEIVWQHMTYPGAATKNKYTKKDKASYGKWLTKF